MQILDKTDSCRLFLLGNRRTALTDGAVNMNWSILTSRRLVRSGACSLFVLFQRTVCKFREPERVPYTPLFHSYSFAGTSLEIQHGPYTAKYDDVSP